MHQNICLYFSDTGGGHRSAVDALEGGIRQVIDGLDDRPDVSIIRENIAEKSHPINRFFVEVYNYLLRHHQPLMKYYYDLLHVLKPNESEFGYSMSKTYLQELLRKNQPAVVVSVHPMINHYLARALTDIGMKHKVELVEVITDPNADLWKAWACNAANLIIAPNDIVKAKLVEWGCSPDRIKIVGMPVGPEFLKPPSIDKESFLSHLGLSPNTFTLCINAGWAGGGNMLKIFEALRAVERPLQVIFLCGHNRELYDRAMASAAESDIPTAVLPFHDCMPDLMSAVDLMVTKAGGLTTYQALAKRLPMAFDVLTEPMPQEKGTVEMLVEQGLAHAIHTPSDIVPVVEGIKLIPDREHSPLPPAHSLDKADAVLEMARLILANLAQPIVVDGQAAPKDEPTIPATKLD